MPTTVKRKEKRVRSNDDKYRQYEIEKQDIALTAKSHEEYELRIQELCERLGI